MKPQTFIYGLFFLLAAIGYTIWVVTENSLPVLVWLSNIFVVSSLATMAYAYYLEDQKLIAFAHTAFLMSFTMILMRYVLFGEFGVVLNVLITMVGADALVRLGSELLASYRTPPTPLKEPL